jgi:hypothetical protein
MLEATGDVAGNIGASVGPDGILLVDTQFAQLAELIQAALETIGIVREKMALGKDLEQIKAEGFPAKYDSWGRGYTRASQWIENIYHGS